jgi:hypothetical protein
MYDIGEIVFGVLIIISALGLMYNLDFNDEEETL